MVGKNSLIACVLLTLSYGSLSAKNDFNISSDKVSLEKKIFTYDYFNISEKSRKLYKLFNENILEGDYISAEKNAKKLFVNVNTLENENHVETELANIALGRIYLLTGQRYKWKYMHLEALDFFMKNKRKIGINDYIFGMLDLNDILIDKVGPFKARQVVLDIETMLKDNIDKFTKKDQYYIYMKANENLAQINFVDKKLKNSLYSLSVQDKYLKRIYTYYSLYESHLLFNKAKYIYDLDSDTDKTLDILNESMKISEKILNDKHVLNKSVFFADINYFIGTILSSGTKQDKANKYLKVAIDIYKKTNSHKKEVDSIFQLINSYKIMNQLKLASEEIDKLKKIVVDYFGKKSIEYADTLISEADILNTNENYKEALSKMNKAKEIYIFKFGSYSKEVKMLNSTLNYIKSQEN